MGWTKFYKQDTKRKEINKLNFIKFTLGEQKATQGGKNVFLIQYSTKDSSECTKNSKTISKERVNNPIKKKSKKRKEMGQKNFNKALLQNRIPK